jgi:3-deoxy-D-manno-octulosonic-acid transferase
MRSLYNLGIHLYRFAIYLASFTNEKAAKWIRGRKNIFICLRNDFQGSTQPLAWFHCASLGEFEQGRPVIEAFREKFPTYKILLTFFSPSGYEARKDYKGADYVYYLPLDTHSNAKQFIEITNPVVALFVKYEFWFNYLMELQKRKIPVFLVSARFRENQYFFTSAGGWFRKQLKFYHTLFLQDKNSESILRKYGIVNTLVCGDTRFDRVLNITQQPFSDQLITEFKNNHRLWICGSTWENDEMHIFNVFNELVQSGNTIKLLIVPHEVSKEHITNIQLNCPTSIKYSSATAEMSKRASVMILDKMGMLSFLYRFADIAYVGGGFNKGIHNLPEAAAYAIPVLFGPNYHKFIEAEDLIKCGGGYSISSTGDLKMIVTKLLSEEGFRKNSGAAGLSCIREGKGATGKIISTLQTVISVY